jgi:hypothetical protein
LGHLGCYCGAESGALEKLSDLNRTRRKQKPIVLLQVLNIQTLFGLAFRIRQQETEVKLLQFEVKSPADCAVKLTQASYRLDDEGYPFEKRNANKIIADQIKPTDQGPDDWETLTCQLCVKSILNSSDSLKSHLAS